MVGATDNGGKRNGSREEVLMANFACDLTGCCEKLFQGWEEVQCISLDFTKIRLHLQTCLIPNYPWQRIEDISFHQPKWCCHVDENKTMLTISPFAMIQLKIHTYIHKIYLLRYSSHITPLTLFKVYKPVTFGIFTKLHNHYH